MVAAAFFFFFFFPQASSAKYIFFRRWPGSYLRRLFLTRLHIHIYNAYSSSVYMRRWGAILSATHTSKSYKLLYVSPWYCGASRRVNAQCRKSSMLVRDNVALW